MSNAHPQISWPIVLDALAQQSELTYAQARWSMNEIMSDAATSAQIAAFGIAVKIKGPTANELQAFADEMREHSVVIDVGDRVVVDIVGTGGDRLQTVNISTMASLVVAATGIGVVKHGNRAQTSRSGGADVLESLGVDITRDAAGVRWSLAQVNIGFCFAPVFHPALRFASAPRRELGIPTVFNVLGPLTNPARPQAGLVGCAFADIAPILARTFADRGNAVLVVRGDDGLDELTTTATSRVWISAGGDVVERSCDPRSLGLTMCEPQALRGDDADYNAAVVRAVLAGDRGPIRDAVLLNAAGAIVSYDVAQLELPSARHVADNFEPLMKSAIERAGAAIDSGAAADLLNRWVQLR